MTRATLLMIWVLSAICALVALSWMALAIVAGRPRAERIALGFDRLGAAVARGEDSLYISSCCWQYRNEQPYKALRWIIDAVFGAEHCRKSFEGEQKQARQLIYK